jgi:hypothetical protein
MQWLSSFTGVFCQKITIVLAVCVKNLCHRATRVLWVTFVEAAEALT